LPTEAEWEIVCRGGTTTAYSFGGDAQLLPQYGWFSENSRKWSHAVGLLRPSPRGLFDIHGNLYEWCHDWSGQDAVDATEDPLGAIQGSARVLRGGGWGDDAALCRTASRHTNRPTARPGILGFRVALVPFSEASGAASEAGGEGREGP